MEQPKEVLRTLPEDRKVTLDEVVVIQAENYAEYHIVAARLKKLQDWVKRIREESLNVNGRNKD